jgi:NAD(P)-dependent dehydrogenase (short-subunit alcohol dehydrogenase family)
MEPEPVLFPYRFHSVAEDVCSQGVRHLLPSAHRCKLNELACFLFAKIPKSCLRHNNRIGPTGRGPYSAAKWGVEGFSEVLSREVAPLGIRVTIIEPGGFRTDFAGSSTGLSEGHPAYDSTVGATARFQRNYNGKQPGDPKKAAQAIVQLTQERNPPLRLLLGSDAYAAAEKNDLARLEEARIWKKLSVSTDFETK